MHPDSLTPVRRKDEGYFKGSPQTDKERDFLDTFEWTPELLTNYKQRALAYLDSLWHADVAQLERIDNAGHCEECNHEAHVLYRHGHFTLCRHCALRRRRVATQLKAEMTWIEEKAA